MESGITARGVARARRMAGVTMVDVMVAIAILAILAMIAIPSYSGYVGQSRAKRASTDLVALGLVYENDFQKSLAYPSYPAGTQVPALPGARTAQQLRDFSSWSPAEGGYYTYTVSSNNGATTTYTLTATAVEGNCTLTLTAGNGRTATGSGCGFSSW